MPPFNGVRARFTYLGRSAVWQAVRLLGLTPGDEVLVPSYNCGSEIDPLVQRGLSIVPYRVLRSTKIDIEDLQQRVTGRTKAVYVIHYFGFPQPLGTIWSFCQSRRLDLVEDCALALFSHDGDQCLGTTGDVAIFSFRKTLPLPDGGAVVVNNPRLHLDGCQERVPVGLMLSGLAALLGRPVLRRLPSSWDGLERSYRVLKRAARGLSKRHGRDGAGSAECVSVGGSRHRALRLEDCYDRRISNWAMSPISQRVMDNVDAREVVARRRHNFAYLLGLLRDVPGIELLLTELPAGVCPAVLPVLTNRRTELCAYLWDRKIMAIEWWAGYHPGINWEEFPDARHLKDRVTGLPIHQDLDLDHMAYVARSVREVLHATEGCMRP